jgi:hypothetical protein
MLTGMLKFPLRVSLFRLAGFCRKDRNERAVFHLFLESHYAVNQGEQGMILAHADIQPGRMDRAALANEDITCFCELAAVDLNAQTFGMGFTSVA